MGRDTSIEREVTERFADELDAVARAADCVASEWDDETTTDRTAAADALETRLREDDTSTALLEMAPFVADQFETTLPADPVARPPYFVVTGEGPMVRVSLDEPPVRVVVLLRTFSVESGDGRPRYRRTDGVTVEVSIERTDDRSD